MTRPVDPGLTNLCPNLIPEHTVICAGGLFFPALAVPTGALVIPDSIVRPRPTAD
jgi:hypothetical protein